MNARLALLMRLSITLVVVVFAAVVTRWMWIHYELAPWSRDGRVRADVVTVAPDVAGFVVSVAVGGNQTGRKGDPPFSSTAPPTRSRSGEHTSELHSHLNILCPLLLYKKKKT